MQVREEVIWYFFNQLYAQDLQSILPCTCAHKDELHLSHAEPYANEMSRVPDFDCRNLPKYLIISRFDEQV